MKSYLLLGVAIVFELLGTSFMKMSDGYSRLYPTLGVFICYGIAFYVLATIMDTLPLNVTYATWSGVGLVATAIIAVTVFGETMNVYKIIGCLLYTSPSPRDRSVSRMPSSA